MNEYVYTRMCVLSFAVRMTSPAYINLAENSSARTHFRATQRQGKENRVSTQCMPRPLVAPLTLSSTPITTMWSLALFDCC